MIKTSKRVLILDWWNSKHWQEDQHSRSIQNIWEPANHSCQLVTWSSHGRAAILCPMEGKSEFYDASR